MSLDPTQKSNNLSVMISKSVFLFLLVIFASGIGAVSYYAGKLHAEQQSVADKLVTLAEENEQMRLGDERMLRARTNFQRPGVTQEEVDWIKIIADDYGMPADVLYAFRRAENGGTMLMLGAQKIPTEIRMRYPPKWWQFAVGAKTWTKHINKVSVTDPYLRHRTLWSFAKQWNPHPDKWTSNVLAQLQRAGEKGLAVTEKPRKEPIKSDGQAKGRGLKPSETKK